MQILRINGSPSDAVLHGHCDSKINEGCVSSRIANWMLIKCDKSAVSAVWTSEISISMADLDVDQEAECTNKLCVVFK